MPKLYHEDGSAYHNTIEYSWVGIPNNVNYDEYMVNPCVANYIEELENKIVELNLNAKLFAEWIASNDYIFSTNNLWYHKSDGEIEKGITTEELFNQFTNKNK